jgi:hypothetical protein
VHPQALSVYVFQDKIWLCAGLGVAESSLDMRVVQLAGYVTLPTVSLKENGIGKELWIGKFQHKKPPISAVTNLPRLCIRSLTEWLDQLVLIYYLIWYISR